MKRRKLTANEVWKRFVAITISDVATQGQIPGMTIRQITLSLMDGSALIVFSVPQDVLDSVSAQMPAICKPYNVMKLGAMQIQPAEGRYFHFRVGRPVEVVECAEAIVDWLKTATRATGSFIEGDTDIKVIVPKSDGSGGFDVVTTLEAAKRYV